MSDHCIVCGEENVNVESVRVGRYEANKKYSCSDCGVFSLSKDAWDCIERSLNAEEKRKLERYLYETRSKPDRLIISCQPAPKDWQGLVIDFDSIQELYEDDGSPLNKYENTIRRIAEADKTFGHIFSCLSDRWLVPTMDDDEADAILSALDNDGYIDEITDGDFTLTAEGLRYAAELAATARTESTSVFIAACFDDVLKDSRDTIQSVVNSLGYKSRIVNREPHNEFIDLKIYELIRESRFVVADLTCNRQSVYYEVGFAHGLGLEVILTCRKDHFADKNDESKRVHFDINHRNILTWENTAELSEKLRAHIYQCFGSI